MGNCLERTLSDDDENSEENESSSSSTQQQQQQQRQSHSSRSHRHRHHHSRSGGTAGGIYSRLSESSSSLSSINSGTGGRTDSNNNTNFLSSLANLNPASTISGPTTNQQQQVFYLAPNIQRTAEQLTEEEQIKLLKRMTLIQQLPTGQYDGSKNKNKECVICMIDFELNDTIKYLPCMHTFHQSCIDNWLVRSLVCPSCIEPVDALILEHMIMNSSE